MSTRIGLAVAADRIRVVAVRGGIVLWTSEADVTDGGSLVEAIAEIFAAAPLPRWPRPVVNVALGPAVAQTKHLRGLPPLADPHALVGLVQEGAGRFFLRNGSPLVTTGIRVVEPGEVWAAAFDQSTVHAVETACHTARLRLRALVPAAVVLGSALKGERILWHDGAVCTEIILADRQVTAVRRFPSALCPAASGPFEPVEPLARLGDEAGRFADAYGAATLPAKEPLVLRPGRGAPGTSDVPGWRRTTAAVACVLAVMSAALAEVAVFDAVHPSATLLLADLTRALPEGSAILTLRIDTAGGTLVALAPRAAAVLSPLGHIPGIVAPEIIGPMTREVADGRELERVTLRFRIDAHHRRTRENSPDEREGPE